MKSPLEKRRVSILSAIEARTSSSSPPNSCVSPSSRTTCSVLMPLPHAAKDRYSRGWLSVQRHGEGSARPERSRIVGGERLEELEQMHASALPCFCVGASDDVDQSSGCG